MCIYIYIYIYKCDKYFISFFICFKNQLEDLCYVNCVGYVGYMSITYNLLKLFEITQKIN